MLSLKTKKILIIEDYSAMRFSIKKMLYVADAQTIAEADNAKNALLMLEKQKFDIILCDFNLGTEKNGQQILEEAKHRKLIPLSTIFIMLTAEQTQSMVLSAMENKPDEYLTKPFNAQQLLSRIDRQLQRKAYFVDIDQALDKDNLPLAIAHCERLLTEQNPRMHTQLLKIGAELAVNAGNFKAAERYYQEVLNQRELAWARHGLGVIAFLQNQFEAAIDIFSSVIQQSPMMMEPYDWLARSYEALERNLEAQDTLSQAVELSPQAILRQQKLAALATQLSNPDVAQRAYKAAIKLGKFSVHKSCRDFAGLAKTYANHPDSKEVLKIIKQMREEFQRSPEAELRAAQLEIDLYQQQGNAPLVEKTYTKLNQLVDLHPDLPKDLLLDIAEVHYKQNNAEAGNHLIEHLIGNFLDDEGFIHELLRRHKTVSKDSQFAEEALSRTKQELIDINNEGVNLFKAGDFVGALDLLETAYLKMPKNKVILMNLLKIMIREIKTTEINRVKLANINSYLAKATTLGVSQDKTGLIKMELAKLTSRHKKN